MRYRLILRDPVYFNEYTHSVHDSSAKALKMALNLGCRFFRIDFYRPFHSYNEAPHLSTENAKTK